ncbi:MAG TPA: glycosyl hydrolase 108 family protein [Steroidobacteraceae bacterium]
MTISDPIGASIDRVLAEESGKFTNDPNDAGGPTKWGITLAELADFRGHPVAVSDVEALTREEAWSILYAKYVRAPKFDQISKLSMVIAAKLIDAGVLFGQPTVIIWLQRCLNAFNLRAKRYSDVAIRGAVGPDTLDALRAFLAWRGKEGEGVLLEAITCMEGERAIELAEKRLQDEDYVYGWILKRVLPPPATA